MSKSDTWMPLYIADYLRKTMHLSREQHGGYFLLLMACWDRGGRLPNDPRQLAGIARATPAEWKKLAPVLLPFFEVDGDWLVQGRVVEEREKAAKLSEARRVAGSQGGRPKKPKSSQSESEEKPNGFLEPSQTETPTRVALPSPTPVTVRIVDDDDARSERDRSDALWSERLEEAKAAGGDGLNLTVGGMHVIRDLRALCEPQSGEPCLWPEVLDAVRVCAGKAKANGQPIRSWTWVRDQAFAYRDRRLAGVRAPADVPLRPGGESFADREAAIRAEARRRVLES